MCDKTSFYLKLSQFTILIAPLNRFMYLRRLPIILDNSREVAIFSGCDVPQNRTSLKSYLNTSFETCSTLQMHLAVEKIPEILD